MRAVRAAPDCLVDLRTLERYCMGRLEPAEAAAITNHINDCPSCAQYLTEIEAMSRALRHAALQARGAAVETAEPSLALSENQRRQIDLHLTEVEAHLAEVGRAVRDAWGEDSRHAEYADQILNVIGCFRRELGRSWS